MNRKVIKPVVLSGLFLAALIVFSIITNQDNKDMTTAMKEATLPIVQFYEGNNSVAQLQNLLQNNAASNSVGAAYADAANAFMSEQAAIIANGPWMSASVLHISEL